MTRFDRETGWVLPWPWRNVTPADIEPFVDPTTGQDTFDGTLVRDPKWYQRDRRRQARVAIRHLDELLADEAVDLDTVLRRAAEVHDALANGRRSRDDVDF